MEDKKTKEFDKLSREIKILENKKLNYRGFKSKADQKEEDKQDKRKDILEEIKKYLYFQSSSYKVKQQKNISIRSSAKNVGVNKDTFHKYLKFYQKYNFLKLHGNTGRKPINRIKKKDVEEIMNEVNNILSIVKKHHKREVPLTLPSIFFHINKIYEKKNQTIPMSLSTFYRYVTRVKLNHISKYANKQRKQFTKKIIEMKNKLNEMSKNFDPLVKNQEKLKVKSQAKIQSSFDKEQEQLEKAWKANLKPGEIVEWDGSWDPQYNKTDSCRQQCIDAKTGFTMGLDIGEQETNKGYVNIALQTLKNGIPKVLLCDKRRGVHPEQPGALIPLILNYFGTIIHAESNSTNKPYIEKINGPCHSFLAIHYALNGIKTVKEAKSKVLEIKQALNNYFNIEQPDFSHLKQITPFNKKCFL